MLMDYHIDALTISTLYINPGVKFSAQPVSRDSSGVSPANKRRSDRYLLFVIYWSRFKIKLPRPYEDINRKKS